MWKGTKLSNLRSTITNMELHNLKSGAPHVELCGYIIELWYSAILGFCSHIKLLGAKFYERELSGSPVISRCRAKAITREFRITDPHSQAFTTRKQYVER